MSQLITIEDHTTGLFKPIELERAVWSLRYQALYQYNRSPWVEHGYAEAISDVQLVGEPVKGAWHIELLDTSDQEGALGYHEDQAFDLHSSGPKKNSARSSRGIAANKETPLSKVFCKTSTEDGVAPTEVASHEMLEMIVDPWVINETQLRKYLDPASKQFYIGEVGDPVQGEGYDVGEPEGRPCGVPEATVANFAYPAWWGQVQTRPEKDFRRSRKAAFELAPGGYMSVEPEGEEGNWSQIYGSAKK